MKTTILLPHYRTGAMTAYSVKRILACRGRHQANIIVIDNGGGVGCDLIPKDKDVTVLSYPSDLLQSHGVAFDFALQQRFDLIEECFVTVESDSFPIADTWLDHYEDYSNQGYDLAGSKLKLSGGTYFHPAGAMYRKSNWLEAMADVRELNKSYNFYECLIPPCYHVMSREVLAGTEKEAKRLRFLPVAQGVFHQGMGFNDEDVKTYGRRSMESEAPAILSREGADRYLRVMYEPGQWFAYWHRARGKKIKEVPTEIRWMPGRINEQQEFTLMENGLKHLWGITAWDGSECKEMQDVIDFKRQQALDICGA